MKKWIRISLVVLAVLMAGIMAGAFFAEEPLRRYAEWKAEQILPGLDVKINRLSIHPITLSVDLEEVVIRRHQDPEPPVLRILEVRGGLRWTGLLTARLVLTALVREPKIFIHFEQLQSLVDRLKKDTGDRAETAPWQNRVESLPRFVIAEFRIVNGEASYVPGKDKEPLTISHLDFAARNIRNRRVAGEAAYASEISMESLVLGSGRLRVSGEADLLRKPVMALKINFELRKFELAALKTIAEQNQVIVEKGIASATGAFNLSREGAVFTVNEAMLNAPAMDFIYTGPPAKEKAKRAKETAKKKARELTNKPGLLIKLERLRIMEGNFGVINRNAAPEYRIFVSNAELQINNFSNQFREGPANLHLKGQFMGSGDMTVSATFRPEKQGPDFTIRTAIQETNMKAMNDVFRAYGKFDVSGGVFSVYSELSAKEKQVSGYVKPLFKDLKVYDKRSDEEKGAFRKLYEKIIGGAVKLLENKPRDEVATETPIRGMIENPDASTWEIIVNLLQNAFFQAILPGFERGIGKP